MAPNTSYIAGNGEYAYLIREDSMALGKGSKYGENVYPTRYPYSSDNPNPRYTEACALIRSRYDRDAEVGTQLLLRERDGARRSLEQM